MDMQRIVLASLVVFALGIAVSMILLAVGGESNERRPR